MYRAERHSSREAEAEKQSGDNRTMGRKFTVPYGLYRAHGFVSAHLAGQTKFDDKDIELLWDALKNMFEHDHSAARGQMASRCRPPALTGRDREFMQPGTRLGSQSFCATGNYLQRKGHAHENRRPLASQRDSLLAFPEGVGMSTS